MSGTLCLQHNVNKYLQLIKEINAMPEGPFGKPPQHVNFI